MDLGKEPSGSWLSADHAGPFPLSHRGGGADGRADGNRGVKRELDETIQVFEL